MSFEEFILPIAEGPKDKDSKPKPNTWHLTLKDTDAYKFGEEYRYPYTDQFIDIRTVDPVTQEFSLDSEGMRRLSFEELSPNVIKSFTNYINNKHKENKDNIGYRWAFFQSSEKSQPVIIYGADVVSSGARAMDIDRQKNRELVKLMDARLKEIEAAQQAEQQETEAAQQAKKRRQRWRRLGVMAAMLLALLGAGVWLANQTKVLSIIVERVNRIFNSMEDMQAQKFYKHVFPTVCKDWRKDQKNPDHQKIAEAFCNPEYIKNMLNHTDQKFWNHAASGTPFDDQTVRSVLYDYFVNNTAVKSAWGTYKGVLQGTDLARQHERYVDNTTKYTVFFLLTGKIKSMSPRDFHEEVQKALIDTSANPVSYTVVPIDDCLQNMDKTYTPTKDQLKQKGTGGAPLLRAEPKSSQSEDWFLVTSQKLPSQPIEFAAFFKRDDYTPVSDYMNKQFMSSPTDTIAWYALSPEIVEKTFHLNELSTSYYIYDFEELKVIQQLIAQKNLQPINPLTMKTEEHKDFIDDTPEDGKGYCVQTSDPIVYQLLAKLIDEESLRKREKSSTKPKMVSVDLRVTGVGKMIGYVGVSDKIQVDEHIRELFRKVESIQVYFNGQPEKCMNVAFGHFHEPYSFLLPDDKDILIITHPKEQEMQQSLIKIADSGTSNQGRCFKEGEQDILVEETCANIEQLAKQQIKK